MLEGLPTMAASGLRPPPPSWGQPGGCGAGPERARPQPLDVHGPPARRGCCAERQRMLGKKQTDKPARRGPGLGCQPDGEHHMQARGYRWLVAPGADVAGPECLLSLVAVQGPWGGSGWPATECVTGEGSQGQVSGHRCLPWSSGEGNRWAALLGGGVRVRLNGALGGQLSHAIPTALDTGVRGHVPSRALGRGPLVPPGQTGRELCVSAFGAPPSKHHHLWLHPWGQSFGETQTERLGLEGAGVARGWEEPMNRGERAAGGGGCTHSRAGARLRCMGRAPQLVGATLRGWSRRLSVCHVGPGSGPGEPLGPDLPTRGHSISLASMRGVAWVPAGLGQRGATGLPVQRPLRGLQSLVLTPAHSTEVPMEATRGRGSGQWWGPDAAWRM